MLPLRPVPAASFVAPHAGAWIEISRRSQDCCLQRVAPHAGAWIEMSPVCLPFMGFYVAPHAGAWIEIQIQRVSMRARGVAPHAGAWIEIRPAPGASYSFASRPTRARGLKLVCLLKSALNRGRAPRGRVD